MQLPQSWRRALDAGRIAHRSGESMAVVAAAANASSVFVDSTLGSTRALEWLRGSRRTTVMRLASTSQQVFAASFDGRWLVYSVVDTPSLDSSWTMYAWDSVRGGAPREIGRSTVAGPLPYPLVISGRAFWTIALSPDESQLNMTGLASRGNWVISYGDLGYPFRFGSLVIWPKTLPNKGTIELAAASAVTGRAEPLPAELQTTSLTGATFENGDQNAYVWSADDLSTLLVWMEGAAAPRTVFTTTATGVSVQWPQVGGSLVGWDDGAAQYIADLRTGSYVQVTPQHGSLLLNAGALVITYAPQAKSAHPILNSTMVPLASLPPLPRC